MHQTPTDCTRNRLLFLDSRPQHEKILIMADMNTRVGNQVINRIIQQFKEKHVNQNGKKQQHFVHTMIYE